MRDADATSRWAEWSSHWELNRITPAPDKGLAMTRGLTTSIGGDLLPGGPVVLTLQTVNSHEF